MALLIWQRPNLILLDEPTNHLDLEMRFALNQALQSFEGSVMLVSHDRHLLRSVCDDLWLVDAGKVEVFDGGIDDYPQWLVKRKSRSEVNTDGVTVAGETDACKLQKKQTAGFHKLHRFRLNQIRRLETTMEKLSKRKHVLEQKLADPQVYQENCKQELVQLLNEQRQVNLALQKSEDDWLELSEALERNPQLH